jgi:hypothetical protein
MLVDVDVRGRAQRDRYGRILGKDGATVTNAPMQASRG